MPAARVEGADYITFTSASTATATGGRCWRRGWGRRRRRPLSERLAGAQLCSIGPVTSPTLRELGLPVAVEARE